MTTLLSDEELRSALESAKVRWNETLRRGGSQIRHGSGPNGSDPDMDFAQAKAVYHRLGCEAAHRWGLVR